MLHGHWWTTQIECCCTDFDGLRRLYLPFCGGGDIFGGLWGWMPSPLVPFAIGWHCRDSSVVKILGFLRETSWNASELSLCSTWGQCTRFWETSDAGLSSSEGFWLWLLLRNRTEHQLKSLSINSWMFNKFNNQNHLPVLLIVIHSNWKIRWPAWSRAWRVRS